MGFLNLLKSRDPYLQIQFLNGVNGLTNIPQSVHDRETKLYGWNINNPNGVPIFIQIFYKIFSSVTLGATKPDLALKVGTNGAIVIFNDNGILCRDALSIAATTDESGATAPVTPVTASIFIARD